MKEKNKARADAAIQIMANMMDDREIYDRRSNYRLFLETKAHYLIEAGQFGAGKDLFRDLSYFTVEERDKAIRDIEISESFSVNRRKR